MKFKIIENLKDLLPPKFPTKKFGSCIQATMIMAKKLLTKGIKDFKIVEGFILYKDNPDHEPEPHVWIELNTGEKIDPTFTQFKYKRKYGKEPYYSKNKKKYKPEEWVKEGELNCPNPDPEFGFDYSGNPLG